MGKSREIHFNENERVDYLSGFHARKQERRKFGIAMQMINDKNKHKIEKKKTKNAKGDDKLVQDTEKEKASRGKQFMLEVTSDDEESDSEGNSNSNSNNELVFNDSSTTERFGSAVSVVIDEGLGEDLDDLRNPDLVPRRAPKENLLSRKEQFDIELHKAMRKAKATLNDRKMGKKSRKKEAQRVSDWKSGKLSGKKQSKKKKPVY